MSELWDGYSLTLLCAEIAICAHQGQFRRDGVTPYIEHPKAVASKMITFEEKAVAWLHDVLEDTELTAQDLIDKGVPERIVDGITYMTKREGESYTGFLCIVSNNPLAKAVKIQDMLHNLSDNPTRKQVVKYAKGLLFLLEED